MIRSLLFILTTLAADSLLGMTNRDVISMVEAGLPTGTIVLAVQNAPERDFDTSAQGLIELSQKGVPSEVINAMIGGGTSSSSSSGSASGDNADRMDPEEVILMADGKEHDLLYTSTQMRTAARAFGWGGVATYMVIRGSHADLEIEDPSPSFLMAVPGRAQPDAWATLASFAVRGNSSREVLVGGGYMSYSTGIHPDRVIDIEYEKLDDQSRAPEGFTLFRATPKQPLEPGEYALVYYSSEVQLPGTYFLGGGNAVFDFRVL